MLDRFGLCAEIEGIKDAEDMLKLIAHICIDMDADGDVKEASELVLPHRMRRKPFSEEKHG